MGVKDFLGGAKLPVNKVTMTTRIQFGPFPGCTPKEIIESMFHQVDTNWRGQRLVVCSPLDTELRKFMRAIEIGDLQVDLEIFDQITQELEARKKLRDQVYGPLPMKYQDTGWVE